MTTTTTVTVTVTVTTRLAIYRSNIIILITSSTATGGTHHQTFNPTIATGLILKQIMNISLIIVVVVVAHRNLPSTATRTISYVEKSIADPMATAVLHHHHIPMHSDAYHRN
jgi:hypothetical protein